MMSDTDLRQRIVIVAGMPRAATTFLYHTLGTHPYAWVPPRKEVEFFSVNHYRGEEWYLAFFEGARPDQVGFDISPIYFMDSSTPERIRAFNPSARVVLLVRDPVEFVLSFFANRRGATTEELRFESFLDGYTYWKDGKPVEFDFTDGRIARTIETFRSTFGANLLLCSYEAIERDPLRVLKAIEAFSGLPGHFTPDNFENVRVNSSDQRNVVWLNKLMHNKTFVDLVVRTVPKSLILRARYWVQTRRRSGPPPAEDARAAADRALAEQRLIQDRRYVRELFERADIQLGTGEPSAQPA